MLVNVRTRLRTVAVGAAALSLCCTRTPTTRTLPYTMPSGKPLEAMACTVDTDAEGRWLGALMYRPRASDPTRREAEVSAMLREIGPSAKRVGIQALVLDVHYPSWRILRNPGLWPELRREH